MKSRLLWTKTPEEEAAARVAMAEARRQLQTMAASGMGMSCGQCGHFDDIGRFTATAIFGELPRNQFQCPACGWAIERRHGKPEVCPSGWVMPGSVTLAPVGPRM